MDNKLDAKDLINVGIFTVIYVVLFFISGMLGYILILGVMLPFLLGALTGLFITKPNSLLPIYLRPIHLQPSQPE